LALAGETLDYSLTEIKIGSFTPYIALASISGGGKYYWAKVFTFNSAEAYFAV
jgi:hypothetical protein